MQAIMDVISILVTFLVNGNATSTAVTVGTTVTASVPANTVGWIPQFISCITSNSLLLVFVVLPLVGLGVGFIGRLIHTRG